MKLVFQLFTALVFASGAGIVSAVPTGGIGDCALPTEPYRDCTFSFQGTLESLGNGEMDTLGPVRVDFALAPFFMPHLQTENPWEVTFDISAPPVEELSWTVALIFELIDGMGNLIGLTPETMGDLQLWHGFQWSQKWTCIAPDAGCPGGTVFTDITFSDVRIGEWEKVPLPTTLTLFALGLLAMRRRITA